MISVQIITSTINHLSIEHFPLEEANGRTEEDRSFDLVYHPVFTEGDNRSFINVFKLKLEHPGEFKLEIEYMSFFSTTGDMDETFKKSPFIKINAPAIAFPYLRSVVSSITMISGYPTAVLPTINFVTFNKSLGDKKELDQASD